MTINHKGISVYFSQNGNGKPIVLLHGFLESSTIWIDLASEISKSNQVISIDLLGHGKTGCLGYIHTMEQMAEAVNAVLVNLGIQRATLIGHSMGGYVALAYLELFPEKVDRICLQNSTALEDSPEKKKNRNRAIEAVKQNHKLFVRQLIANVFRPKNRTVFSKEIKKIKEEALKFPIQGIIAGLEGMKIRKDRVELFRHAPIKKLMIIGRKDPILNRDTLIEQVQGSNIEMVELPDGHMSFIENKKENTDIILHFIEK